MPHTDWLGDLKTQLRFAPRWTASGQRRLRFDRSAAEVLEPRIVLSVTAYGDAFTVLHDRTLSDPAPGVLDNDVGGGGSGGGSSLTAVLVGGPAHASSFTLNSNGSFSYTPATYWVGADSFSYYATDGVSNSNTATVSIDVTNSPPTASADSYSFWYDSLDTAAQGVTGVLANDDDNDSDPLTAVLKSGPSHGTLTLNSNGSFVYTPSQSGWTGVDAFTYAASDGVAESSPVTVTLTRSNPLGGRLNDDDQPIADGTNYGGFAADRLTGRLEVERSVAPGVSLVYDGLSQSDPVIALDTSFASGAPLPTSIEVSLTLGGVTKPTVYYSTSGLVAGDPLRFALQIDDSTLATGRHAWEMTVTARYSGGKSATRVFTGNHDVVKLSDSGFGPGWNPAELDRLVAGTGGALFVTGRGRAYWFDDDGNGGFLSPAGPLATAALTVNVNGSYTLRDQYGNAANFSSAGLLTSRVDRNGNTRSYSYIDADGDTIADEIYQITDPFGRTITFSYTSGRVSSVTDFASRTVMLGRDGSGNLTTVTLPDPDGAGSLTSPVWSYGYASGRLISVTDPLNRATTFTYDFCGPARDRRATRSQ